MTDADVMVALDVVQDGEPELQPWALAVLEASGVVTGPQPIRLQFMYGGRAVASSGTYRISVSHAAKVTRSSELGPARGSSSSMSQGGRYWSGSTTVGGWVRANSLSKPCRVGQA